MKEHYPFSLQPLPYNYDALEPYIDTETVRIHHDKHLKAYVDNLNKALKPCPQFHNWTLEELICGSCRLPISIRQTVKNNAGGVYNHNLYFRTMTPPAAYKAAGPLWDAVVRSFGSPSVFEEKMKMSGLNRFGSGWAYLVSDRCGRLKIISVANQDTPFTAGLIPILPLDVWEHAYYLKYQNRRGDYIDAYFSLINWQEAGKNYRF